MSIAARQALFAIIAIMSLFLSCRKDVVTEVPAAPAGTASQVVFDPEEVPYATLSTYRFFQGHMADQQPVQEVLPYDVITPLFSDYAKKSRFVWVPPGSAAVQGGDQEVLAFPERSVLIKTFYYDRVQPQDSRRLIETRLMFKRGGQWEFANYVWNADQSEAYLDLQGSLTQVTWIDPEGDQREVEYRIPAWGECMTCHKHGDDPMPIGPKPRNLHRLMTYADGSHDQLERWKQRGILDGPGSMGVVPVARWDDVTEDITQRVRAYLDMNCAHCHGDGNHCSYRPIRFNWEQSVDLTALGVCVTPEEPLLPAHSHIVTPSNLERSVLHYRLASTEVAERMPLLGRTVVHEEAQQLIELWINSLQQPCEP